MDPAAGAKEALPKRGFLLALLLALAAILAILPPAYSESLSVTPEHPFLLNGSWVEAQELKEGDILYTINGQQVRITNITRVVLETPLMVYNLEAGFFHDFVVGPLGLVVHNSNIPDAAALRRLTKRTGPDEISIANVNEFGDIYYETIRSSEFPVHYYLEDLRMKGLLEYEVSRSSGMYRHTYITDIDVLRAEANLPPELRQILAKVPAGESAVIKVIKQRPDGIAAVDLKHVDFETEVLAMEEVNANLVRSGQEPFFPTKTYYMQFDAGPRSATGRIKPSGILVQEAIGEPSVREFAEQLKGYKAGSTADKAKGLQDIVTKNGREYSEQLHDVFEKSNMVWNDAHAQNIAVGFKHNGQVLELSDIMSSNVPLEELQVYFKSYEAAGTELLGAGELGGGSGIFGWAEPSYSGYAAIWGS